MKTNTNTNTKVLLYNGFPFHYEMFGCMLYYFNKNNIKPDILNIHYDKWFDIYDQLFKFNYLNKKLSIETLKSYDLIILLTDDDHTLTVHNLKSLKNIFCIDHTNKVRRHTIQNHIGLRNDTFKNTMLNLYPIFPLISYEDKMKILKKDKIVMIGESVRFSYERIFQINNFKNYQFVLINRKVPTQIKSLTNIYKNITVYEKISSDQMIKHLLEAHYIFHVVEKDQKHYLGESLSASIPLSFSTGCQLILNDISSHKSLELKSAIFYDQTKSITIPKVDLKNVFKERDDHLIKNNNSLNNLFK